MNTTVGQFMPNVKALAKLLAATVLGLVMVLATTIGEASAQGGTAPSFSIDNGFYSSSQSVTITTSAPNATIRYTTDGSTPAFNHGQTYNGPITIDETTVLRAIAVISGPDSEVTTATYLFVDDIITQSGVAPGFPSGSVNGQIYNYGMDPDIVNGNQQAVRDALLAIPSVSIVADPDDLFSSGSGIYSNAEESGREWERPASIELIDPSGAEAGFEMNAGLRMRGGFSRRDSNPKHAFRVFFRDDYGDELGGDLDYALFGSDGASSFEKIDFRTAQNYSWSFNNSNRNTFLREVWSRDALADLGNATTRSEYYHLYLNGQYWGLFLSQERLSKEYAESYFGGDDNDYDVLKHDRQNDFRYDATDGNDTAWRALWPIIEDQNITASEFATLEGLIDFDSLIDVNLIYAYTAEIDGAPSRFLGDVRGNNWYSIRNRTGAGEAGKWTFFVHDAEHSLGAREHDPNHNRTTDSIPFNPNDNRYSIDYLHPGMIHRALLSNSDYVDLLEARANQVFRGNGPLTPAANQARWDEREATVAQVILAESARWGDSKRSTPYTINDWANEVAWVENNWFPSRTATVINQLGLPANIQNSAPSVANPGAQSSGVAVDVSVTLTGSDPEGQALTWSAVGLPAGLSIDEGSGVIDGYALEAGTFAVTATATDSLGLSGSRNFTWTTTYPSSSAVILNEWNAVGSANFLKDGGSDSFFGTVVGNGGDWFEIVVVDDHVDLRGWSLELLDSDNDLLVLETTDEFVFNQSSLLADVRAGTIITVSENVPDDASYDPAGGDWWINFQANSADEGGFFTSGSQSNFDTNNDNWQLIIRDAAGNPVFGPAGEGAGGVTGVSSTEIGELEQDPTSQITPLSLYDDGSSSTFGSPNGFDNGFQDFDAIRPAASDTTEPDSSVTSPTNGETLTATAVVATGTATDDVGVAAVQVAVRDNDTGQWLRADGTFGNKQFVDAVVASPGAASTSWSFPIELSEGNWAFQVRGEDTSGNRETTRPWVPFEIRLVSDDDVEPDTSVASPVAGGVVNTTSVVVTGTSTDNVGVAGVQVAVRDQSTGLWLRADGTFGAKQFLDAVVDSPGAGSTDWSFPVSLSEGSWAVQVRAEDNAGNRETTRPWVAFQIQTGPADNAEPDSTLGAINSAGGTTNFTGTASDNVGVGRVSIAIKDRVSDLWLRADGTYGAFEFLSATVSSPDAASTGWTFSAPLNASDYRIIVLSLIHI